MILLFLTIYLQAGTSPCAIRRAVARYTNLSTTLQRQIIIREHEVIRTVAFPDKNTHSMFLFKVLMLPVNINYFSQIHHSG
jgi:hypothetical protein